MSLLSAPRPLIEPLVQGAYQQETSVVHPAAQWRSGIELDRCHFSLGKGGKSFSKSFFGVLRRRRGESRRVNSKNTEECQRKSPPSLLTTTLLLFGAVLVTYINVLRRNRRLPRKVVWHTQHLIFRGRPLSAHPVCNGELSNSLSFSPIFSFVPMRFRSSCPIRVSGWRRRRQKRRIGLISISYR